LEKIDEKRDLNNDNNNQKEREKKKQGIGNKAPMD